MKCPNCGTVVSPGAEACTQCEVRIVWEGDTPKFQVHDGYIPVFVAYDPAMLPVVESLLAANAIPFIVPNDSTQDMFGLGRMGSGYNSIIGPPVVRVPSEHAQAASELIASIVETPAEELPPEE
jgi:hypothetical protein